MSDEEKKKDYPIGYGRPPKRTQFKRGKSGNPNGRPRKRPTLADDFERALRSTVIVTENGKPRKMTKQQAIATQQVVKAVKGSTRSTKLIREVLQAVQSDSPNPIIELVEEFRNRDRRLKDEGVRKDTKSAGLPDGLSDKGDKS